MRKLAAKQRGLTFISLLLLLMIGGFFVLLALRLGPIYLENFTIRSVLQGLTKEPGLGQRSPQEIRSMLDNRLYINDVRRLKPQDFKFSREGEVLKIVISYEVREHIAANVDALVSFTEQVELSVN